MNQTPINDAKNQDLAQLKELLSSSNQSLKVKKNTFLFQEGMAANELFIIRSGKFQISKITPDDRVLSLRICSSGDIIGELTLFSNQPKYLQNAKAIENGEVIVVNKKYLEEKLQEDSILAFEYMKWMSQQFRKTHSKFRDLILHGKKGALYSTLIRMSNSYGIANEDGSVLIDIPLKNQELANFCGTTRESVNRMLNSLKNDGIITIHRGRITLRNIQFLREEINCENCPVEICRIE